MKWPLSQGNRIDFFYYKQLISLFDTICAQLINISNLLHSSIVGFCNVPQNNIPSLVFSYFSIKLVPFCQGSTFGICLPIYT